MESVRIFRTNRRPSNTGFNIWTLPINLFLWGMLLGVVLTIVPGCMEYLAVHHLITRVSSELNPQSESCTDLHVRVDKLVNTNQIHDTRAGEIDFIQREGSS